MLLTAGIFQPPSLLQLIRKDLILILKVFIKPDDFHQIVLISIYCFPVRTNGFFSQMVDLFPAWGRDPPIVFKSWCETLQNQSLNNPERFCLRKKKKKKKDTFWVFSKIQKSGSRNSHLFSAWNKLNSPKFPEPFSNRSVSEMFFAW